MEMQSINYLKLEKDCLLLLLFILFYSCSKEDIDNNHSNEKEPRLEYMAFYAVDNPMQMVQDAYPNMTNDSTIEFWINNITPDKQLKPYIRYNGDSICWDGKKDISNGIVDFKKPVSLSVFWGGQKKDYIIIVHSYTGLPVLWIETDERADITSKEDYLHASFKLVEDAVTRGPGDIITSEVLIKGRGNTSWEMPKKGYRLKFPSKISLFSETKDKSYVLIANYADKSMLRNVTAFYMSSISSLDYTPKMHFVELMLNGKYHGTYLLGDKLTISESRVNVGKDGFLLEVDLKATADDIIIRVPHISAPINVKEPDGILPSDSKYIELSNYLLEVDSVLYSESFLDKETGYKKYIDIESFVDWYLINEISKNNDACMATSCYMNLKIGDKIKMGPVWDYDIAFGNINYSSGKDVEGFHIKYTDWFARMFEDPEFVHRVKERFYYFYTNKQEIYKTINQYADYLKFSIIENNNRWGVLYTEKWPNYDVWGSYANEVENLKIWLDKRFEWLKSEFDKMN